MTTEEVKCSECNGIGCINCGLSGVINKPMPAYNNAPRDFLGGPEPKDMKQLESIVKARDEKIQNLNDEYQTLLDEATRLRADRDGLLKTLQEMKKKLKDHLPDECTQEWHEVKFCHVRNGDGWQCKHCAN